MSLTAFFETVQQAVESYDDVPPERKAAILRQIATTIETEHSPQTNDASNDVVVSTDHRDRDRDHDRSQDQTGPGSGSGSGSAGSDDGSPPP